MKLKPNKKRRDSLFKICVSYRRADNKFSLVIYSKVTGCLFVFPSFTIYVHKDLVNDIYNCFTNFRKAFINPEKV